jgi:hypothetical protein
MMIDLLDLFVSVYNTVIVKELILKVKFYLKFYLQREGWSDIMYMHDG